MAKRKNPAAVAMGKKGGRARVDGLTEAEWAEHCRKAAEARWSKKPKKGT